MSTQTAEPEVPFLDMKDPNFSLQSPEARAARDKSWYAKTPYGIAVLRQAEANKMLKDKRLRQGSWAWPDHNGVHSGLFYDFWGSTLINYEGADHARLRRVHNPAFTPKVVESLKPRFEQIAEELIDGFIERGECDIVAEFTEPYAARIICILLDLPEVEWKTIADWSSTIGLALGVTIKEELPNIEQAMAELNAYADAVIASRRANPQDDFVTKLVEAADERQALSELELRTAVVNAVFAGMDTTRNQLGLAIYMLVKHSDQWELLGRDSSLARPAVEEAMRVAPTVTWVTREAIEDFEFEGAQIEKGTTIHLITESAGTDPHAGSRTTFNIAGESQSHFGFGGGIHQCLGHYLARADMAEALTILTRRITDVTLTPGAEWLPETGNTGPTSLPIRFRARGDQ
ncbi:cytochrome P450 [Leucobacter sp. Z1108]|uniref:cytochrome P450 n=1 Tax=Leucobacter sp. Z1108 TaxID=3439066 RepID=UPI003F39C0DE